MTNQTILNNFNDFELYLEGIRVPFSSVSISEGEGQTPSASITMSATASSFRVLPGTMVQFFGPREDNHYLLFEGYIATLAYFKRSSGGRQISFNCLSNLSKWDKITVRPSDAIMTKDYAEAVGNLEDKYINLTNPGNEQSTQETNENYAKAIAASKERIQTELYGELKDLFKDIKLSQKGEFADEVNQLFGNEKISSGDLDLFIQFFLKKFELYDLFYGIDSLSIGLSESVVTFPNVGSINSFKFKSILENTFQYSDSMREGLVDNPLHLARAIKKFLNTLHYTQINPSAFTSTLPFWNPNKEYNREMPVRSYFCPNLENSPPAKCNLFFPHDITSLSFNHNMTAEPTRTIGQAVTTFADEALSKIKGLKPFVTEPKLNITNKGSEKNKAGFTLEETYRGIEPMIRDYSDIFALVEGKEILKDSESGTKVTKEQYKDFIDPPLNQMTRTAHTQARLSQRNLSLQTPWNPDRLIGVPGAVIGEDDEPSFTGVVSAVTTRINASGQAVSTVALRAVRTIFDLRDLNKDNYEFLINDFTSDPYNDLNSYQFDPEVYSFRKIGETLYPVFMKGTLGATKGSNKFLEYAGEEKAFTSGKGNMEGIYDNNLNDERDFSVLDILRDPRTGEFNNFIKTDLTLKEEGDIRNSTQYTRDVYEALYRYKDLYNEIKEEDGEFLND